MVLILSSKLLVLDKKCKTAFDDTLETNGHKLFFSQSVRVYPINSVYISFKEDRFTPNGLYELFPRP